METVTFEQLSRGEQYKVLLTREYEDLARNALLDVSTLTHSLKVYTYATWEREELEEQLRMRKGDLNYYRSALKNLKGAENEDIALTVPRTEPLSQFAEISCTTVL